MSVEVVYATVFGGIVGYEPRADALLLLGEMLGEAVIELTDPNDGKTVEAWRIVALANKPARGLTAIVRRA